MTLLFIFVSLFIGIRIRGAIVLGIVEALLWIIFLYIRSHKKFASINIVVLLIGVSISFIRFDFVKAEYSALVVESYDNYFIVESSLEKFYISEKDQPYEVGDILLIKGDKKELNFTHLESEFDFKEYLNNKGIYYELVVNKIETKFSTPFKIHQLKKNFLSKFDDDAKGLVSSIIFGHSINTDSVALLNDLHLHRLISSSGLYLQLFLTLFISLLSIFMKKKWANIVSLGLFGIYSIFTYPRFIVIKFLFLNILRWINKYVSKKKFDYLTILSFTGIVFLLLDYHLAYQDSFLLTYIVPIFLLMINSSIKKYKKFKKRIIVSLLLIGFFIPFTMRYYHELSPFSILLQIILTPFMLIYGLMGLLSFLGIPLYSAINGYTHYISEAINFIRPVMIKIYVDDFPNYLMLIYEIIYIAIIYFKTINLKPIFNPLLVSFISLNAICILPIKKYISPTVTFINVGQGDSCLINYKNTAILIDTGGLTYKDVASEVLIPYFKKNQIYDIDLLITTHDDYDHKGASNSLIANFTVKEYIKDYDKFPINCGGIEIKNFNVYSDLWNEENDKSLVLSFYINPYNFLITGDAPKKIETAIIKDHPNLKTDILKVGHHGSNTSSSEEFIKTLKPQEAVISCGYKNKYGHPHSEVISILNRYKIKIRRTDLEGSIIYKCYMY